MKPIGTKILETEHLILRKFQIEDAPFMYQNWTSDSENIQYLTFEAHPNPKLTQQIVQKWVEAYSDPTTFKWAITLKSTRELIGDISVVRINQDTNACSLGYVLSKKYWGRGLMTEALHAVIKYLITQVDFNRVEARHDSNNPASGKVMKKAGMKYEGTLRKAGKNNQGIIDEVIYAFIKTDCLQ